MRIDYRFTYGSQFKRHLFVNGINFIMALLTLPIFPVLSVIEQVVFKNTFFVDNLLLFMLVPIIVIYVVLTVRYYTGQRGVYVGEDRMVINYCFYHQNVHGSKRTIFYSSIESVEITQTALHRNTEYAVEGGAYKKPYVAIKIRYGDTINLPLDDCESFVHNVSSRLTQQ